MSARVTVRLPDQLAAWLAELGGDQAATARALMVIGAAQLGLPGIEREAWRLLAQGAGPQLAGALGELTATRQPRGSHAAATRQPEPGPVALIEEPADDLLGDLLEVGIDV